MGCCRELIAAPQAEMAATLSASWSVASLVRQCSHCCAGVRPGPSLESKEHVWHHRCFLAAPAAAPQFLPYRRPVLAAASLRCLRIDSVISEFAAACLPLASVRAGSTPRRSAKADGCCGTGWTLASPKPTCNSRKLNTVYFIRVCGHERRAVRRSSNQCFGIREGFTFFV